MKKMVQSIGEKAIFGARQAVQGWSKVEASRFECQTITGGLTNKLNLVRISDGETVNGENKALVRIFGEGTDEFIDRGLESVVCDVMSSTGIAPKVFGKFPGGRAEEFIDNARSVLNSDLHRPEVMKGVAKLMAKMHSVELNSSWEELPTDYQKPLTPIFLRRLWHFACRARFNDAPRALKLASLQVGLLAFEIEWLEKQFKESEMGIVLCHRDLQSGNVMVSETTEGILEQIYLIDFEYSGMDYCGFDFGNTFCEMSLNNFCTRFPGFVLNPEQYPSKDQQRTFFETYLSHMTKQKILFPENIQKLDLNTKVDKLIQYASLGMLASSLQWTLWAIVQSEHSSIDFGYLEYANARLDQFHVLRREYEDTYEVKK